MPTWLKSLKVTQREWASPLKVFVLKRFRFLDGGRKAFVAVYLNRPAVVIDLTDPKLRRIVVSHRDAATTAETIRAAAPS